MSEFPFVFMPTDASYPHKIRIEEKVLCAFLAEGERERCAIHLDGMAQRAESPAIKAAYKQAAKQLRELK